MKHGWRTNTGRFAVVAVLAATGLATTASADPSLDQLNSALGHQQAREQTLSGSVARLSQSIAALGSQISLVESREAALRSELVSDRVRLGQIRGSLARARAVLAVIVARLDRARGVLTRQLVSEYEGGQPDLVSVVLEARGFSDLLNRIHDLRAAEQQQSRVVQITRQAKQQADAAAARLSRMEAAQAQITDATAVRVRALAGMNSLLHAKQGALSRARAAQASALAAARARAGALQSKIAGIHAQQAAAAGAAAAASSGSPVSSAGAPAAIGPSGGWAIPAAIVMCESGGQNLPPNSAGASGYYQILPSTWKLFGGSGPAAYLSGKAEQDAVASRIWNGGAGASNWVCAGIVGIH